MWEVGFGLTNEMLELPSGHYDNHTLPTHDLSPAGGQYGPCC